MHSAKGDWKYQGTAQQRKQHLQELSSLQDVDGATFRFVMYKGVSMAPFPGVRRRLADYEENFVARSSDVMICAFAKSGTHWVHEMSHMIMNKSTERPLAKENFMLERVDREEVDKMAAPRLLNTHTRCSHLSRKVLGTAKVIYITRDVRDVAVSLFHHVGSREQDNPAFYQPTWRASLDLFCKGLQENGDWFVYTKDWHDNWLNTDNRTDDNTIVLHYEQMKQQPRMTVLNLAKFLLPQQEFAQLTDEFIDSVLDKTGFSSMQADRSNDCAIRIYRKGVSGDWKNQFSDFDIFHFKSQLFDPLSVDDKKLFLQYSSITDWE